MMSTPIKTSGCFISLEGIDGAGKSTHIEWIKQWLLDQRIDAIVVREPGGTPLGETLREMLLQKTMHPITETLLVFAARYELIETVIKPTLAQGTWIVSDRFIDATYAYQGGGRGIANSTLDALTHLSVGSNMPDCTFFFEVSSVVAKKRRHEQSHTKRPNDRFEQENECFFERVREAYHQRQQQDPKRIIRINSETSITNIRSQLAGHLERLLIRAGKPLNLNKKI